jgi:ABC-type multidrug transport system fused ATPase/permease subunit
MTWKSADKEFWEWGEAATVQWHMDLATLTEGVARRISFPTPPPVGATRALLRLNEVSFGYPNEPDLFTNLSLSLEPGSRSNICLFVCVCVC